MDAKHFCESALKLVGTPYSQIDCIGVVRTAAGIRCQGTNWLWRSYESKGKYQYLTWRMERPPLPRELKDGMLVFRCVWDEVPKGYSDKPNCYHVGIIYGNNVIQSQERPGVNIKQYLVDDWHACGWLKFIEPDNAKVPIIPSDIPFSDYEEVDNDYTAVPVSHIASNALSMDEKITRIYDMVQCLFNKEFID